tara:strand:- start:9818 stop:10420 length:603 start_codon:yes stop_codon:yes gene_type:complete
MSYQEVVDSYDNSIEPSENIKKIINNLIVHFSKDVLDKRELLHLLNVISPENKTNRMKTFEKITKSWKKENNSVFASIIIRQNLYSDIYVEMLNKLEIKDQESVISIINNSNLNSNEMKTIGVFFAKWAIFTNMSFCDIYKLYQLIDNKVFLVINLFIFLCKNNRKDLIDNDLYKKIKSLKHSTNTLMAFYDLEELMEEN